MTRSIPESEFGKIHKDRTALIQKWANKLDLVKDTVSLAVAMANNHLEGFAPVTANKLSVSMGLSYVTWNDTKQRPLFDFAN